MNQHTTFPTEATAASSDLDTIDALFDGLGDEAKLMLVDHLCQRAGLDLNTFALAYDFTASQHRTVEEASAHASRIADMEPSERDRMLRYYLRNKLERNAA